MREIKSPNSRNLSVHLRLRIDIIARIPRASQMASASSSSVESNSPDVAVAQTFKVLVLGDSGVGKTSIIQYYKKGVPSLSMISTVGESPTVIQPECTVPCRMHHQ